MKADALQDDRAIIRATARVHGHAGDICRWNTLYIAARAQKDRACGEQSRQSCLLQSCVEQSVHVCMHAVVIVLQLCVNMLPCARLVLELELSF